jgi:hypothetical protein
MAPTPMHLLPSALRPLLKRRICDLPLSLKGSPVASQVRGLYRDLKEAGFQHFRPFVYLGDEWFSPEGLPVIAVPFYLADERLKKLEAKFKKSVEGGTPKECRQLLRHEAGHAFEHAFLISKNPRWRRRWEQLFGDPRQEYTPERYRSNQASLDFVVHLPDHYAQAHPDEDFAETFAVCMNPLSRWQVTYKDAPKALAKLHFVNELIRYYGKKKPKNADTTTCYDARRLRRTLATHYGRFLTSH